MKEDIALILIICLAMVIGAFLGIIVYTDINQITPMDVYQGKTTLEYTIVDGEKIDSCVILKK